MSSVTTLFTQYSAAEIVIFLFLVFTVIKFLDEIVSYFYEKIKTYLLKEQEEENQQNQLLDKLDNINTKIDDLVQTVSVLEQRAATNEKHIQALQTKVDSLNSSVELLNNQSKKTEEKLHLVQKRMQDQTKDSLIEAHHRYVYELKTIDDIGLESMERTYLYYKAAGGNSFIDTLMDEVRKLPRLALKTEN